MAQTVVQTSSEMIVSSGSTGNMTLNGVAAGNLLVAQQTQETDGTTFATNSDGTNTWIKDIEKADATRGSSCIESAQNVAGGNTTVTVTMTGGVSKTYRGRLSEVSGSVTTGVDVTSSITEPANVTSHVSSVDASHINPTGACIVFTSAACNASAGTRTPGSGYTAISSAGNFTFWQQQIFSSAPTNERGAWTSANSINSNGVIAAYKAAAAASFVPWGNMAVCEPLINEPTRVLAY